MERTVACLKNKPIRTGAVSYAKYNSYTLTSITCTWFSNCVVLPLDSLVVFLGNKINIRWKKDTKCVFMLVSQYCIKVVHKKTTTTV